MEKQKREISIDEELIFQQVKIFLREDYLGMIYILCINHLLFYSCNILDSISLSITFINILIDVTYFCLFQKKI